MKNGILSVFVDESGVLAKGDTTSRFYILALVAHDQSLSIAEAVARLDRELGSIGIANLHFHAGPIIHAHDQFVFMNWDLRRKIFYRMLAFANHVPFRYACLVVDKKYADSTDAIVANLARQLADLVDRHRLDVTAFEEVRVYYDCGQKPVTNLLHEFFEARTHLRVVFAQAVKVARYKMLQVADLVCTLRLIQLKLEAGLSLSRSEEKFFGGTRAFRHNVLRVISRKEIASADPAW